MPLTSPQLDDRRFDDLVNAARERVQQSAPTWTDLSTGEPGITLLEVFAYLADTTIFRLNQVPDKLYVEFLKLIGVRLQPPAAAIVDVRFRRERDSAIAIDIPRGTRVTAAGPGAAGDLPVFATLEATSIAAGTDETVVRAIHAELVEAELLGRSTGAPGQSFRVARRPIIAPSGDPLDLVIGVEATAAELERADRAIEHDGRPFRIWRVVDDFADVGAEHDVYVVDRFDGLVTFAPAARILDAGGTLGDAPATLAGIPPVDREVRAWYRHGGGPAGNVKAGTLTTLRDAIPGVTVANPGAATGGRAAETLQNALVRGPQELRSLNRAVTARDFRLVAERSSGAVARAHAFTQAALWRYARPGTVEVVMVPALPDAEASGSVTVEQLTALESPAALAQVTAAIDLRRPLGTSSVVRWARYKSVRVRAEIVVHGEEDVDAVRARVDERIHRTIDPLPSPVSPDGWPFGQSLHASRVYRIILSEPGVRHARRVRLLLDEVPDRDVQALTADPHQPRTWYTGSGDALFRSLNDGDGWELMARFEEGRQVRRIEASEQIPGLVAVATAPTDGAGSSVHVTFDSGESWPFERPFGFRVEDLAWVMREGAAVLLMATGPSADGGGGGLYQMDVTPDADAVQVLVDPSDQDLAFYAVTAFQEVRGDVAVAVAAQGKGGVYLSKQAGHSGTFEQTGLKGEDVRVLGVQPLGPRAFLWAGTAAPGGDQVGKGLFRRELLGADDPAGGWEHEGSGWIAGSCWAIAFEGTTVVAATQQFGVMRLVTDVPDPAWTDPTGDVHNGLPLRDLNRFLPVRAVAARPGGGPLMAGGPEGVFRTVAVPGRPGGLPRYENCSEREHDEEVTLPPTWLFVCGENELVVRTDAPG